MDRNPTLKSLLSSSGIPWGGPGDGPAVSGLAYDSRGVRPSDLFFAIPGENVDGHDFVGEAARRGAVAAIVQRGVPASIPTIEVRSVTDALSALSAEFYAHPSRRLPVVGVTGTNGKTTTVFLIEDAHRSRGLSCAAMGTVSYRVGGKTYPAPNTTPLALDVHRFLGEAADAGCAAAAMEVSSHALELGRVRDVRFAVGVFTNLTQDHLDFHKDMDAYFRAKARLFLDYPGVRGVINIDDEYGRKLKMTHPNSLTFGLASDADVRAANVTADLSGVSFDLHFPSGAVRRIESNLMGRYNVSNTLAAAAALVRLGWKDDDVAEGLSGSHAVPGRLERVENDRGVVVLVDYAHTPDALRQALTALKDARPKRLLCVFGAGGDRDRRKRPLMARAAAELSDFVVITSDNPRTEDPRAILKDVEEGMAAGPHPPYRVIENRGEAIRAAVAEARPGDIVLIAGKGHETYQIYGREKIHFSDQEEARAALSR